MEPDTLRTGPIYFGRALPSSPLVFWAADDPIHDAILNYYLPRDNQGIPDYGIRNPLLAGGCHRLIFQGIILLSRHLEQGMSKIGATSTAKSLPKI